MDIAQIHSPVIVAPAVNGHAVSQTLTLEQNAKAFQNVLRLMLAAGDKVSDLIFSPGRPPQVELSGDLHGVEVPELAKLNTQ